MKILFICQYIPLIRLNSLYFPTYSILSLVSCFVSNAIIVVFFLLLNFFFGLNTVDFREQISQLQFTQFPIDLHSVSKFLTVFFFQRKRQQNIYYRKNNRMNFENVVFFLLATVLSFTCSSLLLLYLFSICDSLSIWMFLCVCFACQRARIWFAADFKVIYCYTPIHKYGKNTYISGECTRDGYNHYAYTIQNPNFLQRASFRICQFSMAIRRAKTNRQTATMTFQIPHCIAHLRFFSRPNFPFFGANNPFENWAYIENDLDVEKHLIKFKLIHFFTFLQHI